MSESDRDSPNLYLVGFMGTGKSVVGRAVARELRLRFIDTDAAIEMEQGRPIPEIFAQEGERFFRSLEREFIRSGHPPRGCVVSCGGGLVVQPGMAEAVRKRGIVVSLFASAETIVRRTKGNPHRPLLNVENPEQRIRELLMEREPHYLAAGPAIMTDGRTLSDVVGHVARIYRRYAGVWKPVA